MGTSQDFYPQIETEIAALKKGDILRSGRSYNNFINEFSGILAQGTIDSAQLQAAGMDISLFPKYNAMLEILAEMYGNRIATGATLDDASDEFKKGMVQADNDKKILAIVIRFIIARTQNTELKQMYNVIRKGAGYIDTLNDNIAMVKIIHDYADIAAGCKPGSITVDEAFLNRVNNEAIKLIALKGQHDNANTTSSQMVDKLNRIITLALGAEREIKLFAELAFFDDPERYNRDYSSESLRHKRTIAQKKEADAITSAS